MILTLRLVLFYLIGIVHIKLALVKATLSKVALYYLLAGLVFILPYAGFGFLNGLFGFVVPPKLISIFNCKI